MRTVIWPTAAATLFTAPIGAARLDGVALRRGPAWEDADAPRRGRSRRITPLRPVAETFFRRVAAGNERPGGGSVPRQVGAGPAALGRRRHDRPGTGPRPRPPPAARGGRQAANGPALAAATAPGRRRF